MQDKPVREQDSRASFGEAVYAAIDRQDFEEAFRLRQIEKQKFSAQAEAPGVNMDEAGTGKSVIRKPYGTSESVADLLASRGVASEHVQPKALAAAVLELLRVRVINLVDPAQSGVDVKQAVLDLLSPTTGAASDDHS